MGEQNGDNPRISRIEEHIEVIFRIQRDMQQEHQSLLRAQVVQGEELRQLQKRTDEKFQSLAVTLDRLAASQDRLAAAQERMDEALTALIGTVDTLVRHREKPGS